MVVKLNRDTHSTSLLKVEWAVLSLGSLETAFTCLSPIVCSDATQSDVCHELRACTQLKVSCCFLHRESLAIQSLIS